MLVSSDESLAPPSRMYGVVGSDGRLRFFDNEIDAASFFADPFSDSSRALVRGTVDLASVTSTTKVEDEDGASIRLGTPGTVYTIRTEDANLLGPLYDSLKSIVGFLHRALAALFGGNEGLARGNPGLEPSISPNAMEAMRQLEAVARGSGDATGNELELSARALRQQVLAKAAEIENEDGVEVEMEIATESNEGVAAAPAASSQGPFAYPDNVVTGSFMKLGSGFFSGWHRRLFALVDGDTLVWFSSEDERRAFFSDSTSDQQRQEYKRKLDLLAVVSCRDTVTSGRHVLHLSSPTRSWELAGRWILAEKRARGGRHVMPCCSGYPLATPVRIVRGDGGKWITAASWWS